MTGAGSLPRRLLGIGRVAGRRGESGGVRFAGLLLATLVLGVGLSSVVAVHAGYEGVRERGFARAEVEAPASAAAEDVVLTKFMTDALADGRVFEVRLVSPGSKQAPRPPGVAEWPERGEVLMSPALLADGAGEGIAQRYGTLAGTIGAAGLTDPSERMVYLRPTQNLQAGDAGVHRVSSFGISDDGSVGAPSTYHRDDRPEWTMQPLVVGLFVLPGLALMLVAARTGSHARDRRSALVTALGGTGRDRAWLSVGEAWRPIAVGAAATATVATASMMIDMPIPVTGYVLSAADMRRAAIGLITAIAAAVVLVLAAVVWANRHRWARQTKRRAARTRPVGSVRRRTWVWAGLCPVMIFAAIFLPDLVFTPRTFTYFYSQWGGVMGTALTLPALISMGTVLIGRALAWWGRNRKAPGQLVAGQRIAMHSGPTGRTITGITIGIFLFLQAVGWQSIFASQSISEEVEEAAIGRSAAFVEMEGPLGSAEQVEGFVESLPDHAVPVAWTVAESEDDPRDGVVHTIHGSCVQLLSLDIPCSDAEIELAELPRWLQSEVFEIPSNVLRAELDDVVGADKLRVKETENIAVVVGAKNDDNPARGLFIVDDRGEDVDLPALKHAAYHSLPSGADLTLVGGNSGYAVALYDKSQWALLFGVVAVTIMAAAAALSGAAEFLRHGRALAPLTVLTGGFRVFRSGAAWVVSLPLCLAIVVSLAVGTWLAKPVDRAGFITPSLLATVLAITVAISVAMSIWAGSVAVRQAKRWKPGGAD